MRDALRAAKLLRVDRPLDPDLEVTRFLTEWQRNTGTEPCFLFNQVAGSQVPLVMNLPDRTALLDALGLDDTAGAITELARRLGAATPSLEWAETGLATHALADLAQLPLLRHQPRDAGKYLTSFVGSLQCPETGLINLGFYRGLVSGPDQIVLFMDPRTDAHRIVTAQFEQTDRVPISLYNGGPLASYLAGAAKIPPQLDSFAAAARFAGRPLKLVRNGYPAVPHDAEVVIQAHVTRELRAEGPFGEFKGYYCAPTMSPVVQVDRILVRDDALCFGLFCGKHSGLTLMALQNEIFMAEHLARAGFGIDRVTYPLAAFGEYMAIIETQNPSRALVAAALDFDKRAKVVAAIYPGADPLKELAIFPSEADLRPYMRYGQQEGHRIGLFCDRRKGYDWTEF